MFDKGEGRPVIVVQPLQGRWQWMRPFLEALATRYRVITYTLCGDFGADRPMDPAKGFDLFVQQLDDVMNLKRLDKAALCGISFGGTVAVRYAALHPERVTHLVVASSPGPGWKTNAEQEVYVSRPLVTLPAFLLRACLRLQAELRSALPRLTDRVSFVVPAGMAALRFPALPHLMARRVRLMQQLDLAADCARISAPTLVITGEPSLDQVVPVDSTKRYAELIPHARYQLMDRTGHLGVLTQPSRFARMVEEFVNADHP
jgi:pimeloyl-ACP methyl ester carboxylesterase